MLKDITLGQFFPGDTFIHRLDPRTKLIAVILYIVALFNAKGVVTYAMVMAVLVLCIAAAVFVFTGAMSASIALLGDAADSLSLYFNRSDGGWPVNTGISEPIQIAELAGGFVERKKGRKAVSLVPVQAGVSLVTILPEQLQSPLLTAEWEHKLGRIERGELSPEAFLTEITQMVQTLVSEYQPVPGAEVLFPSGREVVGNCPRCGSDVTESKKGFFCEKSDCKFGLWRDNKFLSAKRISLTKLDVTALLKSGRVYIKNIYSEKTGKTFDADLLLDDNGERTVYRFDFGRERTT